MHSHSKGLHTYSGAMSTLVALPAKVTPAQAYCSHSLTCIETFTGTAVASDIITPLPGVHSQLKRLLLYNTV